MRLGRAKLLVSTAWWSCGEGLLIRHAPEQCRSRGPAVESRAPVSDSDSCHSRCPSSVLLPFLDDLTMPGKPRSCRKPLGPMNVPPGCPGWRRTGRIPPGPSTARSPQERQEGGQIAHTGLLSLRRAGSQLLREVRVEVDVVLKHWRQQKGRAGRDAFVRQPPLPPIRKVLDERHRIARTVQLITREPHPPSRLRHPEILAVRHTRAAATRG